MKPPKRATVIGIKVCLALAVTAMLAASCARSTQQEAQDLINQQAHIAAVNTSAALVRRSQTAEANATGTSVEATQEARDAPRRGTATAMAADAASAALATQAAVVATATVEAASVLAEARATQIVAAAATSSAIQASQTAQAIQNAAEVAAWFDRRNAAAPYLAGLGSTHDSVCQKAGQIASETDSVQAAVGAAMKISNGAPGYGVHCEGTNSTQ
jgi:hypothetical protein